MGSPASQLPALTAQAESVLLSPVLGATLGQTASPFLRSTVLLVATEQEVRAFSLSRGRTKRITGTRVAGIPAQIEIDEGGRWLLLAGERFVPAPGAPPLLALTGAESPGPGTATPRTPGWRRLLASQPVVTFAIILIAFAVQRLSSSEPPSAAAEIKDVVTAFELAYLDGDGRAACALLTREGQKRWSERAEFFWSEYDPEVDGCMGWIEAASNAMPETEKQSRRRQMETEDPHVFVDGDEAELILPYEGGGAHVFYLARVNGDWLLSSATSDTRLDRHYTPTTEEQVRWALGWACERSAEVQDDRLFELGKPDGTPEFNVARVRALALSKEPVLDRLRRLAKLDLESKLIHRILNAVEAEVGLLHTAAGVAAETGGGVPDELNTDLSRLAIIRNDAFAEAGVSGCRLTNRRAALRSVRGEAGIVTVER